MKPNNEILSLPKLCSLHFISLMGHLVALTKLSNLAFLGPPVGISFVHWSCSCHFSTSMEVN